MRVLLPENDVYYSMFAPPGEKFCFDPIGFSFLSGTRAKKDVSEAHGRAFLLGVSRMVASFSLVCY